MVYHAVTENLMVEVCSRRTHKITRPVRELSMKNCDVRNPCSANKKTQNSKREKRIKSKTKRQLKRTMHALFQCITVVYTFSLWPGFALDQILLLLCFSNEMQCGSWWKPLVWAPASGHIRMNNLSKRATVLYRISFATCILQPAFHWCCHEHIT